MAILIKNHKLSMTPAVARAAQPGTKEYVIWDMTTPNLGLKVLPTGRKVWVVARKLGRDTCKVTLGVFCNAEGVFSMTYPSARQQAIDVVAQIRAGIDPNLEKKKAIARSEDERDQHSITVETVMSAFLSDRESSGRARPRTLSDLRKTIARLKQTPLASVPVLSLTGEQLANYYDQSATRAKSPRATNGGRTQAGQDLRYLRAAYSFGLLKFKLQAPSPGPIDELGQLRPGWYRVNARSRSVALTERDLADWWSAVESIRPEDPSQSRDVMADYLEISVLWGGRRGEITRLRWDYVDLDNRIVIVPGAETKNGRAHVIPITDYVFSLLCKRKTVAAELSSRERNPKPESPWVFPSRRVGADGLPAPISEPKTAIKVVGQACGFDFSSHDLRRTFGTLFSELGAGDFSVKKALNHAPAGTAERHYLLSRIAPLRVLYQRYEDKVLAEAGVRPLAPAAASQPAPADGQGVVVDAEQFAQFQYWVAQQGQGPATE